MYAWNCIYRCCCRCSVVAVVDVIIVVIVVEKGLSDLPSFEQQVIHNSNGTQTLGKPIEISLAKNETTFFVAIS